MDIHLDAEGSRAEACAAALARMRERATESFAAWTSAQGERRVAAGPVAHLRRRSSTHVDASAGKATLPCTAPAGHGYGSKLLFNAPQGAWAAAEDRSCKSSGAMLGSPAVTGGSELRGQGRSTPERQGLSVTHTEPVLRKGALRAVSAAGDSRGAQAACPAAVLAVLQTPGAPPSHLDLRAQVRG